MKNIDWQKWKSRLPLLTAIVSMAISGYFALFYLIRVMRLLHSQYIGEEVNYLWWLVGSNDHVTLFGVISVGIIGYFGFLVSTRVKVFKKKWLRLSSFLVMHVARWSGLVAYGMGGIKAYVVPFFQERLADVITTDDFVESILFEHADGFYLMLTSLPMLFVGFVLLFLMSEYSLNDKELNKAFFNFEYKGKWLQKFGKLEQTDVWPDVELGENLITKEMVTIPGFDRSLNSLIVGGIGTGKTAALALPMLNQDLHHMTRFINEFPQLSKREDYLSKDVAGRHLNGITVIEPSNDLCQKTLQLVKAHGIPDEAITYINPLDPDTPSINPMRGPVDKVAEVFAQIIAGLNNSGASGNFFFEQAQRNHLKQHIYLLKLHDPDLQPTFGTLIDMYNSPNLVRQMHESLKETIPPNIDSIEDRQERNYWKIIQGIDEWFDLTILPVKERTGAGEQQVYDSVTRMAQYYDAKAEHVQGLRNILNDIGSNPYIRNVLFGESEFDFDEHFAKGGVLLVNTAKGQLVDLARVLGKLVLMNLQNATFRRPNDVSPFHHIMVDEAPDYFYDAFREFPVQSRKYKVIITTIMQTIAQLADEYGENYMTTIIAGMRNRMVYGDVPAMDAEYFSNLFGEKEVFDEGQTEMSVSPLQDNPQTRGGSSYAKVKEPAMTPAQIMFQDAFNCAVKIVQHNKPIPVQQIKANFLPAEAFIESEIQVMDKSLKKWLSYRKGEVLVIEGNEETKVFENPEQEVIIIEENVASERAAINVPVSPEKDGVLEKVGRINLDKRPTNKPSESAVQKFEQEKDSSSPYTEIPKVPVVAATSVIEKIPVAAAVSEPLPTPAPITTAAEPKKEAVEEPPIEKPIAKPIVNLQPPNDSGMFGDMYAEVDKSAAEDKAKTEQGPMAETEPPTPAPVKGYEQSKLTSEHHEFIDQLAGSIKEEPSKKLQDNEKKSSN